MAGVVTTLSLVATLMVAEAPRPEGITIQGLAPQQYIADANGATLYVFDGDKAGEFCIDECLQAWPPLLAKPGDQALGSWKPVVLSNGQLQWAYMGWPVYRFSQDQQPGEATGHGRDSVWHALEYEGIAPTIVAPPAVTVKRRAPGFLLTDYRDKTLYTFAEDGRLPACTGECLEVWPPLQAPALAHSIGDWQAVDRPDAVRQWSYQGKLVYTFSGDTAKQHTRGAGAGGGWHIIIANGSDNVAKRSPKYQQGETE